MPYVTQDQILGEIPQEWRDAALSDSASGALPATVWTQLQVSVEDDIAGALTPAYAMPATTAADADYPIIRVVRSAARILTLCRIYRRRNVPDAENPWAKESAEIMKTLRQLGQSTVKGPSPRTGRSTTKFITEPSRLTPSASRRRTLSGSAATSLLYLLAALAIFAALLPAAHSTFNVQRSTFNVNTPKIPHSFPAMEAGPILESLSAALSPLIIAQGGTLSIQAHEADAVAHLLISPSGWRVVLICDAEDLPADDGLQEAGWASFKVKALIQHQDSGLEFNKGASVFQLGSSPHAVPLLDRCTWFRLQLLRIRFTRSGTPAPDADHEHGWKYLGRQIYAPTADFLSLRTYQLSFTLAGGLLTNDFAGADPVIPAALRND
jgi:hypothetical protein